MLPIERPRPARVRARASRACWRHWPKLVSSSVRNSRASVRALAPRSRAQASSVAWRAGSSRIASHRARRRLSWGQRDAQRHRPRAAQLVGDQRGQAVFAFQHRRGRRRAVVVDRHRQHQRTQQVPHLQHAAGRPVGRVVAGRGQRRLAGQRRAGGRSRCPGAGTGCASRKPRRRSPHASTPDGIQTAREGGTRNVPRAAVSRITPVAENASCAHGWACGTTWVSAAYSARLARTGRAAVGTKRWGVCGPTVPGAGSARGGEGVRGMFSIEVDELS